MVFSRRKMFTNQPPSLPVQYVSAAHTQQKRPPPGRRPATPRPARTRTGDAG